MELINSKNIYDISVVLGEEDVVFPEDMPFSRKLRISLKDGSFCDLSELYMTSHCGTHIDMPSHFIINGLSLDDYSVKDFILPAKIIEIKDKESVNLAEIENEDIKEGQAVLFKTANSLTGICSNGKFSEEFVYITPEAAEFCINKKVSLIGIDYATVDKYGGYDFPVHKLLLKNNILILEDINLKEVLPGEYTLICLPLKIMAGEASPVRAVLFSNQEKKI
ncbi:MAG: cyclase family protein [Armatimonadota bacterium]